MIIRKPSTLDIVKIANIVNPDDPEFQADFTDIWLQKQNDPTFIGLVAVYKKKVLGYFAGHLQENDHLQIVLFKGETSSILEALWKKVLAVGEILTAEVTTSDVPLFEKMGFKPVFSVMNYEKSLQPVS